MSTAVPTTAATLHEAKLAQSQLRLNFLWNAAHTSTLVQQHPHLTAIYMRQLRQLAHDQNLTLSVPHTQLTYCSNCSQINIPGWNSSVKVEATKEKQKRVKKRKERREKRTEYEEKKKGEKKTGGDDKEEIEEDDNAAATDSDAAAASFTPRKRKRSASPRTPRTLAHNNNNTAASTTSISTVSAKHSSQCVASRCHTCGHIDRARGLLTRQRAMLHQSSTDIDQLAATTGAASSHSSADSFAHIDVQETQAKKQRLLQSLQSQSTTPAAVSSLKPTLASMNLLNQAQQRFQQAKNNTTNAAVAPSMAIPAPAASSSFFQEQFKNATSTATQPFSFTTPSKTAVPSVAKQPPPASSAASTPFTFSRSNATPPPKGLYALLQQSTTAPPPPAMSPPPHLPYQQRPMHSPTSAAAASTTTTPAAPFSFSKQAVQTPKKPATNNNPQSSPPNTPSTMQGIQIVGGMKSLTNSKTYTIPAKGGKNVSNKKR